MDTESLGSNAEQQQTATVIAAHGGPAYLRRGWAVQDAFAALDSRCRGQRDEWLKMPRLQLGRLARLAGAWERLAPWLADDGQAAVLRRLHEELAPRLRTPVERTSSERELRIQLRAVVESLVRFNRRFDAFLRDLDLAPLNTLIQGYNRNYVFEKECAVRSPRLARHGFEPLRPFTQDDLLLKHPPLPVPQLRAEA